MPESAGYLMLALGRAMAGLPLRLDPSTVLLGTEGVVTLAGTRTRLSAADAAAAMRAQLTELLEVSQGPPGSLAAALEPPRASAHPLHAFFAAVTRALIPINRGASKRALARLARETLRAKERGPLRFDGAELPGAAVGCPPERRTARDTVADEDIDVDVSTPTPSPVVDAIELATPTPNAARARPSAPVLASIELVTPTPSRAIEASPAEQATPTPAPGRDATPTVVDAVVRAVEPAVASPEDVSALDTTPSAMHQTRPYRFADRGDRVALGPVSPSSIRFEPVVEHVSESDIDAAFDAVRALSPVAPVVVTPAQPPEDAALDNADEIEVVEEPTQVDDVEEIDAAAESAAEAPPAEPAEAAHEQDTPEEDPEQVLVERLRQAAEDWAVARRRARVRGARKLTRLRAQVATGRSVGELEQLLEGLAGERDRDAVAEAAASLQRMVSLELTPSGTLARSAGVAEATTPAPHDSGDETPTGRYTDEITPPGAALIDDGLEERSIPPALMQEDVRPSRKPIVWSAGLLAAGLCAAGIVHFQPHRAFAPDRAPQAAAAGQEAPAERCFAEIDLTGLPSPHEILLRLGEAPLRTRPLPTGVRLELVAMAPGHRPARLVVPRDADWQTLVDARVLRLETELERGSPSPWPDAPPGEVGGVGPAGVIDFEARPAGVELWLVAAAGEGGRARVTLPCDEARLVVVATEDPATHRRLRVPAELLRAAAETGPAEVAVGL